MSKTFYDFFAGGGMVRAGLGVGWDCILANDMDVKKADTYRRNWGGEDLLVGDIASLSPEDLPGTPDLIWGSFPCQDLSLAGSGAGLDARRSGAFWSLVHHIQTLKGEGRAPSVVAFENVLGTLSSHGGDDFTAICTAVTDLGYAMGAFVCDAVHFVPQSRPRLFVIGLRSDISIPKSLRSSAPVDRWHPPVIKAAYKRLPQELQNTWQWWTMPEPPKRATKLSDVIEDGSVSVDWDTALQTNRLLLMMNETHLQKVVAAKKSGTRMVGTVYKRTRLEHGQKFQRAEIRFDGLAGCLRTPAGGSSRQAILMVQGDVIRSRLVSPRETARLMGLPDTYLLPERNNEAYHLTGDGVAVPVVRYIANHLFEKLLA